MLNMEHGGLAYGPDLSPLPAPHEPWPVIRLPPLTAKGLPVSAHYRPTVGLVYYTVCEGFRAAALVERLAALLGTVPEDHLKGYRAAAATPATVLRHRGRVRGGTLVVGPRRCYKKPAPERDGLPARLLLHTPEGELEPPPHYSARAAFTWVFMPVPAALAIRGVDSMPAFNALVAALFYDAGRLCRLAEGADFRRLTLEDFGFPPLPAFLAPAGGAAAPAGAAPVGLGDRRGALVVAPAAGRLAYVGAHRCLEAPGGRHPASHLGLPEAPWDPAAVVAQGPGQFQCCACDAPIGGAAVLIREPKAPALTRHREWFFLPLAAGEPLLRGENAGRALLLCLPCWGALESAECLTGHMGARLARTTVPLTQAEACAACPGYEGLGPLLAGSVRPVPGAAGAFVVTTPADGPGGGLAVVLAGEKLGQYPALTVPGIAALRLPVVAGLRIAEARGAWPAGLA